MPQYLALAFKPRDHVLRTFALGAQNFDGDFAIEIEIGRSENDTTSTAPDDFGQLVSIVEDIACFYCFDYTHLVARRYLNATISLCMSNPPQSGTHQKRRRAFYPNMPMNARMRRQPYLLYNYITPPLRPHRRTAHIGYTVIHIV